MPKPRPVAKARYLGGVTLPPRIATIQSTIVHVQEGKMIQGIPKNETSEDRAHRKKKSVGNIS
jgi:hypothetical protein